MPLTQKFSLVCDDVRKEDNGKLIVLGIYTPDIAVPQIPFSLPTLTFLEWIESDRPGDFHLQLRLSHLETGQPIVQGGMGIHYAQPGMAVAPIRLTNVALIGAGPYVFSLHLDGQEDLITQFSVVLQVNIQQQQILR